MTHTIEPWRVTELDRIISDTNGNDDYFIADCFGPDAKANARRIVSCVNACEGLTQDHFDGGWKARELIDYAAKLERERNQLRELCSEIKILLLYINAADIDRIGDRNEIKRLVSVTVDKAEKILGGQ